MAIVVKMVYSIYNLIIALLQKRPNVTEVYQMTAIIQIRMEL